MQEQPWLTRDAPREREAHKGYFYPGLCPEERVAVPRLACCSVHVPAQLGCFILAPAFRAGSGSSGIFRSVENFVAEPCGLQ